MLSRFLAGRISKVVMDQNHLIVQTLFLIALNILEFQYQVV